ncbi:MAG: hypothetical protein K2I05_00250, partial [Mailhella sp.]|nr:hypothetical protein [Mailhella sp.]
MSISVRHFPVKGLKPKISHCILFFSILYYLRDIALRRHCMNKIIAANWKMNKNTKEAVETIKE